MYTRSLLLLFIFSVNFKRFLAGNAVLTNSYIPAGLQVMSDYLEQLKEESSEAENSGRGFPFPHRAAHAEQGWYDRGHEPENTRLKSTGGTESQIRTLMTALNREAKRQNLGKYEGFDSDVIADLEKTSKMTSAEQLSHILHKIHGGEIRRPDVRVQVKDFLKGLEDENSRLRSDLMYVKPLQYLS